MGRFQKEYMSYICIYFFLLEIGKRPPLCDFHVSQLGPGYNEFHLLMSLGIDVCHSLKVL